MPRHPIASVLAVTALVAALAPSGAASGGGGSVVNVLPTIESLAVTIDDGGGCAADTVADRSGVDRIRVTGTLRDANGEADLVGVRVVVQGAANLTFELKETSTRWDVGTGTIDTTPDEQRNSSHPDSGGSRRMNVWDDSGSTSDGIIRFNLVLTPSSGDPTGVWTFAAHGLDESGNWSAGPAGAVEARVTRHEITVDLSPVDADGNAVAAAWGDWSAAPGATNVESRNFLQVRNTGDCPQPEVTLSWDGPTFTGYGKPSATIPLAGNLQYHAAARPATGTPAPFGTPVPGTGQDAAATFAVGSPGSATWIRYTLTQLPSVAEDLTYRQTLTATCADDGCTTVYA